MELKNLLVRISSLTLYCYRGRLLRADLGVITVAYLVIYALLKLSRIIAPYPYKRCDRGTCVYYLISVLFTVVVYTLIRIIRLIIEIYFELSLTGTLPSGIENDVCGHGRVKIISLRAFLIREPTRKPVSLCA